MNRSAREQFDRQAAHYDRQWNDWNRESLDWMLSRAELQGMERVLDVATGTGFTALAFAPLAGEVTGLDVSTGMLAEARVRAARAGIENVTFEEGAAEALLFPDGSFDVVTCRIAAHHFTDVDRFLAGTARVLAPGGRFLLADTTVPEGEPEAGEWQNEVERLRDPSHVRNLSPVEWRRRVEAAGLRVVDLVHSGGTIEIPMPDWLVKAGCTPEQSALVRKRFDEAPPSAIREFQIRRRPDGEITFAWQRVLLHALEAR